MHMLTDTDTDYNSGGDNHFTRKMEALTSSINDASRSMKSIERLHREMNSQHATDMDMLKDEISRHHQEERLRNMQSDLAADAEIRRSPARPRLSSTPSRQMLNEDTIYYVPTAGGKLRRSGSVRFVEEGVGGLTEYHDIHQSIRDLTNEHTRLREEILRQTRESSGPLRDHVEHVRRAHSSDASAAAADVEKRLAAAQEELKTERRQLDRRHADLGVLSPALNAALDRYRRDTAAAAEKQMPATPALPPAADSGATAEGLLRSRLKQTEATRQGLESEVEAMRRKLDHMDGSNQAMQRRLADAQSQMAGLERENRQLRGKLEDMEASSARLRHRQEEEESGRRDRMRLEREIFDLRTQLSHTVAASEADETRRAKEKAERARDQLQDQVLTLTREVEKKEKTLSKLLDEVRETQARADNADRARAEATAREEAAEKELREARRREELGKDSLVRSERLLQEAESAKELLQERSSETIKQLKAKAARQQKELDRMRETLSDSSTRADRCSQEGETLQRQIQNLQAQCDAGRHEVEDLLAARSRCETQLRTREEEIDSMRLLQYELEAKVESGEKYAEKLIHDAEALRKEMALGSEERARLEERLAASEAALSVAQEQLKTAAKDYKELAKDKAELAAQHSETTAQHQERQEHQTEVRELGRQIEEMRREERRTVSALNSKLRHLERDSTAQLQALRLALEEERSAARSLRTQAAQQGREIARLHDEALHAEEELGTARRRLERAREQMEAQQSSGEEEAARAARAEEAAEAAAEAATAAAREVGELMRAVTAELDAVVEAAAEGLSDLRAALVPPGLDLGPPAPGDDSAPARWLAEVGAKAAWVRAEVRRRREAETRLRQEAAVAREQLQTGDRLIDELRHDRECERAAVAQLVDEVRCLQDDLEQEKTEKLRQKLDLFEATNVAKAKAETERETMRIQERYLKLRRQLDAVRQDPPRPRSESPSLGSPTPMNMSDLEFRDKFLPRCSPLVF